MTDTSKDPSPRDLYVLPIDHPLITARQRWFRECEAMMNYYLSRGAGCAAELAERIAQNAIILDRGIEHCDEIDMVRLMHLHCDLSGAIAPALPITVELLEWDARTSRWNWLAPVGAIRFLLMASALALLVIVLAIGLGNGKFIWLSGSPPDDLHQKWYFALANVGFLCALAGLGACFSVLYDARKFVVDGTYDPRAGSNYVIRLLLGVISGLLLGYFLFGTDAGMKATAGLGQPVVGLLGGFASQFVYEGMQRLVEGLRSMFDASPARQVEAKTAELRNEMDKKAVGEAANRALQAAELAARYHAATSETARTDIFNELTKVGIGAAAAQLDVKPGAILNRASATVSAAKGALGVGAMLLDVIPGGGGKLKQAMGSLQTSVDGVDAALAAGREGDVIEMGRRLLGEVKGDPARAEFVGILKALAGPAKLAGLSAGPAGLAVSVLSAGFAISAAAYERWKTRILDAPYRPELMAGLPFDTLGKLALDALPDLAARLGPEVSGDPAAISDFASLAAKGEDDALFGLQAAKFAGDRALFDSQIHAFRLQLLGASLAGSVPAAALKSAGVASEAELFRALDALRGDPQAAAELDRLLLLGSRTRREADPALEAKMLAMVNSIRTEELA